MQSTSGHWLAFKIIFLSQFRPETFSIEIAHLPAAKWLPIWTSYNFIIHNRESQIYLVMWAVW